MEELVVALIFGVAALGVAWFVVQPAAVFVVGVLDGVPQTRTGKVTESFLSAVAEVCQEFGVRTAEVRGIARGARISLRFSSSIPPAARQRLRNWWAISGWSAKPQFRR